jgi:sugar phosphate isomerase/epimerase
MTTMDFYDQHWPIGAGIEDWPAVWNALVQYAPGVSVILESDSLEANQRSLAALRESSWWGS